MTDRNFEVPRAGFASFDAPAFNYSPSVESLREAPRVLGEVRRQLEKGLLLADLAERVYLGGFVADAEAAAVSLFDLTRSSAQFDIQSFDKDMTKQQVSKYLEPFQGQDSPVSHCFPRLWLPATAVIPYRGEELAFASSGFERALNPYNLGSFFRPDIRLPQLVDPLLRTFDQFEKMPQLDPDHPKQLKEAYQTALDEQRAKHPIVRFREPAVVRAVATLPIGREYMTDFLPQIELADRSTVWAPWLLTGGTLSVPCKYLYTDAGYACGRVVCLSNANVKGAALRIIHSKSGEYDAEREISALPLVNHEDYSMAVILFPYELRRTPRPALHSFNDASGELPLSYNTQAAGDATVAKGSTDRSSPAEHEKIGIFVPKAGGQPLIYSIRLFTVSAEGPS